MAARIPIHRGLPAPAVWEASSRAIVNHAAFGFRLVAYRGPETVSELESRRKAEQDPQVAQDLAILLDAARRQLRGSELYERLTVSYYALPRLVFGSVRGLLDEQVATERRPAALVRVRKYAGLEGTPDAMDCSCCCAK